MNNQSASAHSRRRTIVAATPDAARRIRLQLARAGQQGTQVMQFEQLAARLSGGFAQAADEEALQRALRICLPALAMGELDGIRDLPGTPRALLSTLRTCWLAGFDLQAGAASQPRVAALAVADAALRSTLPPSVLAPPDLAAAALARLSLAPIVLGEVELIGLAGLDVCWQPVLLALANVTRVRWRAGSNAVPAWLAGSAVTVEQGTLGQPQQRVVCAAHAAHEALEAMRWVRQLLASGQATASDIAIASVNPADYDHALQALSAESGLDLHFVHGRPVAATREGQLAAALADSLLNGLTRRGLRRCALAALPQGWARALPQKVTLRSAGSWNKALSRMSAADWPDGADGTASLREIVEIILAGPTGAEIAGERLLSGRARLIWRRALLAGPAPALLETIAAMRQDDGLDGCSSVSWMPAAALAAAPRPYVWLLGLNAGVWPRQSREDGLLPGHIVPARTLNPVPLAQSDRQAFDAIAGNCARLVLSFARRDGAGRHASGSALLRGLGAAAHLELHAPAPHAVSEADRLLGRPLEYRDSLQAASAHKAWHNWRAADITEHDGLVRDGHPALAALVARVHSASSLKSLLRNPIAQLWEYGMKWRVPDAEVDVLELDAMQFGKLVHAVAEGALEHLEADGSLAQASSAQLQLALQTSLAVVAERWEQEEAIPPAALWRYSLRMAAVSAFATLEYGRGALPGARAFAEVGFGGAVNGSQRSPWDRARAVEIPGTGLAIKGVIDRLDLSADGKIAIVRDYKTGKGMLGAEVALAGGAELQRCLYAFAVRALLAGVEEVHTSLLYTRHMKEFVLHAPEQTLDTLRAALLAANQSFAGGRALPGPDAGGAYDDFALLLPANSEYGQRKQAAVLALLADAAKIWEMN
nr:PD-(D/E)XK nuclease family protein [uncultured Duganella sp.]